MFILSFSFWSGLVSFFVTLVISCVTLYSLYLAYLHRKYDKVIPGPERDSFFLGNLKGLEGLNAGKTNFAQYTLDMFLRYGNTFKIYIMHRVIVFSLEEDVIREILVTNNHPKSPELYKHIAFPFGRRFLGRGLVTERNHEVWAHRRPVVQEAFSRRMLRHYAALMSTEADKMVSQVKKLKDESSDGIVEMSPLLHRATFNIIGRAGFSMSDADLATDGEILFHGTERLMNFSMQSILKPFSHYYFPWNWININATERVSQSWRAILLKRLSERAEMMAADPGSAKEDIIHFLFKARETDSDYGIDEMADDMATFYVAGSDTTAITLSFVLVWISLNPDVLRKLKEEITREINPNEPLTFDSVSRLEYMTCVIKESLRLSPPLDSVIRCTSYPIKSGKYVIPSGSEVAVSLFAAGVLPDSCKWASEFLPERFDKNNDDLDRPSTYKYIPFSTGSRNCIGQVFAMLEAKIILTKFVQAYNFRLPNDYVFKRGQTQGTLRPQNGVPLILA